MSLIHRVWDQALPAELHAAAWAAVDTPRWRFGHGSTTEHTVPFWKLDLDGDATYDAVWAHVKAGCEAVIGKPLRVIRQYANGHTYGLGGASHHDDVRPGTFTWLYYPMLEWHDAWDGETVWYDGRSEVIRSVRPRPNRAVLFDARIPHAGRAPSRACSVLRVTVAYKLEVVPDAP